MDDGRLLVLGALGAALVVRQAMKGSRGAVRAGRSLSRGGGRPTWTGPEGRFVVSSGKGKPRSTGDAVSLSELSRKVALDASVWGVDGAGRVTRKLGVLSGTVLERWLAFAVEDAIVAAEGVLPIFEAAYPNDDRPRKAIEAAREALRSPTRANRRAAADAAANAAAADAAYYAAAAAHAAAAHAATAANAAAAASAAANAAAYTAAYTAAYAEQGRLLLGILQEENP
jgi:hypothetical protein